MKQNWFNTLNEALESEGLVETWDMVWVPIGYGQNRSWTDNGRYIQVYRETDGRYERPIHYKTNIK